LNDSPKLECTRTVRRFHPSMETEPRQVAAQCFWLSVRLRSLVPRRLTCNQSSFRAQSILHRRAVILGTVRNVVRGITYAVHLHSVRQSQQPVGGIRLRTLYRAQL